MCFHLLILSVVTSGTPHYGGESPRFGHVWRSPPASCSTLVAGNKFGSAEIYKNIVLKMEGLRDYESRPSDGDNGYND